MQTFLTHGDVCTRVEAEALRLATHGASELDEDNPLQIYNDMFDNLGQNTSLPPQLPTATHNTFFRRRSTRRSSQARIIHPPLNFTIFPVYRQPKFQRRV